MLGHLCKVTELVCGEAKIQLAAEFVPLITMIHSSECPKKLAPNLSLVFWHFLWHTVYYGFLVKSPPLPQGRALTEHVRDVEVRESSSCVSGVVWSLLGHKDRSISSAPAARMAEVC